MPDAEEIIILAGDSEMMISTSKCVEISLRKAIKSEEYVLPPDNMGPDVRRLGDIFQISGRLKIMQILTNNIYGAMVAV